MFQVLGTSNTVLLLAEDGWGIACQALLLPMTTPERCIPLLPLLEHRYAEVVSFIQDKLQHAGYHPDLVRSFPFDALLSCALMWPTAPWPSLAMNWLAAGYPMAEAHQQALARITTAQSYPQYVRNRASRLLKGDTGETQRGMEDWQILRFTHQIGSPLPGIVVAHDDRRKRLLIQTRAQLPAELPYDWLVDQGASTRPELPAVGQRIDTVVNNVVKGVLYLSARPHDLLPKTIAAWAAYYAYIDTLTIGSLVTGRVIKVQPFGLFVDIGGPYPGLIDIGHTDFNQGVRLPRDYALWPTEGATIRCRVSYMRLHNRQIGLGWVPE